MLESLVLILIVSPIAYVLVKANKAAKDYFDYDNKKCRYISRVTR